MNTVLSIAGSDPSGGAGIQADIKTIMANGCYAMAAISSLTAQNTMGVTGVMAVPADFLEKQLEAVFADIFPDAVKIGMVATRDVITSIADVLKRVNAKNVVCDTVMVSTSGSKLIEDDAIDALASMLFPLATVITPNIPEAEILSGMNILNMEDMEKAAKAIHEKYSCAVLVKGGHSICDANDILLADGKIRVIEGERIDNPNTHGTGCTLSSAIAANLAKGYSLEDAVRNAKAYISGALAYGLNLGNGSGPLHHGYHIC